MLRLSAVCLVSLWLVGCSMLPLPEPNPRLDTFVLHSEGLEGNLLADDPNREIVVYLPPSYLTQPKKQYPVVYLLHGYGLAPYVWTGVSVDIQSIADRLMRAGTVNEMIIVMPNANTVFGGTFYYNSATVGLWEDFIVKDLVQAVESRYRVKQGRLSRGIAGHSMGAHGEINIAMDYPDVFSSVYGLNSCCLGFGGGIGVDKEWYDTLLLDDDGNFGGASFKTKVHIALATALSANPDNSLFYADMHVRLVNNKVVKNHDVYQRWVDKLPLHKIAAKVANLKQLTAISFDSGHKDFPHIPKTSQLFSDELTKAGVEHQFELHEGGHFNQVKKRLESHVLPFFSTHLSP